MTTPTIPRPGKAQDGAKDGEGDLAGKKGKKDAKDGAPTSKKKKKLIIIGAVLLVAAAAYMFLLKPEPASDGEAVPGMVVKLDPLTLNLDDGRYLKLAMALQFTAAASGGGGHGGGSEEPDGSKALDLAIAQLSNRKIAELNTTQAREAAKQKLLAAIAEAYHDEVMDLYFTEFVMQ